MRNRTSKPASFSDLPSNRKVSVSGKPALCALASLATLAGCANLANVAPSVTPAMVGASGGATAETLTTGRRIFTTQCTSCHNADPVAKHSFAEWRRIVGEMSARAKLSGAEEAALLAYLQAAPRTAMPAP